MKIALVLLLSCGAALAADPPQQSVKDPAASQNGDQVKRLGSLTWDPNAHKLVWVIEKGTMRDGEFVPGTEERYEISPDQAVMAASGEQRGFTDAEALNLHKLLDVLSLYCAESVVWWDEGQGTPLQPPGEPASPPQPGHSPKPGQPSGQKPVRVGEPAPEKPAYRVPDTDLVAALMRMR